MDKNLKTAGKWGNSDGRRGKKFLHFPFFAIFITSFISAG